VIPSSTRLIVTLLCGWVGLTTPVSAERSAPVPPVLEPHPQEQPAASLIYVSDYFSFVGQDGQGRVAFALDNNRGRDGAGYQAEHFAVLHDERQGWIEVIGDGPYENITKELLTIPNSSAFKFQGSPAEGISIISVPNNLLLQAQPVAMTLRRQHEGARYEMGSAPASLQWAGRTLNGRVIYEHLMIPEFNRMTRTYWRLWKDFQAFYLTIGHSGDLYVHRQEGDRLTPLVGHLTGFTVMDGRTQPLEQISFTPLAKSFTFGLYRWPVSWRLEWKSPEGLHATTLTLSDRKRYGNWVIGGFSMGIVKGELSINGKLEPLYGLAELIM
jgi:hypothetical protein